MECCWAIWVPMSSRLSHHQETPCVSGLPITDGFSENFSSVNRNKRSIALNLKSSEHLEIARRLVEQADVLVENNRPGVMDRLGLGYAASRRTESRIGVLLHIGIRANRSARTGRCIRCDNAGNLWNHERDRGGG